MYSIKYQVPGPGGDCSASKGPVNPYQAHRVPAATVTTTVAVALAQLALHNPHIWANSLKPVCFLCFLLIWCPLLPFIETGTLKIYTKMVLYMKNELLTSIPPMGFEPTLYQP